MRQTESLFEMPSCTDMGGIAAKREEFADVSRNWAKHKEMRRTIFLELGNVANSLCSSEPFAAGSPECDSAECTVHSAGHDSVFAKESMVFMICRS